MMVSISTYAQQPKWSLHNSEVDYTNNSTSSLPNGHSPDHVQNALWDDAGNLQFYVADGIIYNRIGNSMLDVPGHCRYDEAEIGYSEVLIIPVPNECKQYFVVFSLYHPQDDYNLIFDPMWNNFHNLALVYWKVDMTLNSGLGGIVSLPNDIECGYGLINIPYEDPNEPNDQSLEAFFPFHTQLLLGSTSLRESPLLFVTSHGYLNVFDVSQGGISLNQSINASSKASLRGELEIYENTNTNEIVVAYPYMSSYTGQLGTQNQSMVYSYSGIEFAHFNTTSLSVNTQYQYKLWDINDQDINSPVDRFYLAKGIEFSGSGQFFYFSQLNLDVDWQGDNLGINGALCNQGTGDNLICLERLNNRYDNYHSTVNDDPTHRDLGLGMLENGKNGRLFCS